MMQADQWTTCPRCKCTEPEDTLKENIDCELNEEGHLWIAYWCRCNRCHFSWSFEQEVAVPYRN